MTTAPAEIPIYKSQVAMGILVSLFFKLLAYWRPEFGELDEDTRQGILLGISAIGDFVALAGRIWSKIQPIVFSSRAAAAVAVLFLVSCQTPTPGPTVVTTVVSNLPESVQDRIKQQCGWIEPLANLAYLIQHYGGFVDQLISEVCAVTKPTLQRAGIRHVRGVALKGHRVSP
jgi:hypothetical protein